MISTRYDSLKKRAAKLEQTAAWKWFESKVSSQKSLEAEVLHLLIKLDVLKEPPTDTMNEIERCRDKSELDKARESVRLERETGQREDFDPAISALLTFFKYELFLEAPKECRVAGAESRLVELSREWLSEVRPDVAEWPLGKVKEVLEKGVRLIQNAADPSVVSVNFLQGY